MNKEKYVFLPTDILLPKKSLDFTKWAVIACDQYTSNINYWENVSSLVADVPSTLNLIYPEVYLDKSNTDDYITTINDVMAKYLRENVFDTYEQSMIWLKRKLSTGLTRNGLVLSLDLEAYDYHVGTHPLIRSTEETIIDRIPPRVKVRENAPIELPHIVLLYHDPTHTLINLLQQHEHNFSNLYDFTLMQNGGELSGYLIPDKPMQKLLLNQLHDLVVTDANGNELLGVMGDGNHSLASAKAHWEKLKKTLTSENIKIHPARYALVELVNLFDSSMEFEPIHRILFNADINDFMKKIKSFYHNISINPIDTATIPNFIKKTQPPNCVIAIICSQSHHYQLSIYDSNFSTATAALQYFIDDYLENNCKTAIDYIHGENEVLSLSLNDNNIGIILPAIIKEQFFDSILKDGPFPRKTFSIGHADDKRFYLEARKIK
jgi:hypothetical protein